MYKFTIALIFCTFLLFAVGCTATPEDRARWAQIDREAAARRALLARDANAGKEGAVCIGMQRAVLSKLKAPSTADFPDCAWTAASHVSYKGDGSYEFSSWVDAQNGFGAQIRTYYDGVAVSDTKADRFEITSLTVH